MTFYQLLCITTHAQEYIHIKELVRQSAMHVMNAGGVVRNIRSWGTLTLPQRMKRHRAIAQMGDYWTLQFDASPRTVNSLNAIMRSDPRVIRWSVTKLGSTVETVAAAGEQSYKSDY